MGLHPRLHHLGPVPRLLYSTRDVGPAGISRLVAMPHLFRIFPRSFQNRTAYRAIRPAVAGWLRPRLTAVPVTLGRKVVSASAEGSQLRLKLDDHAERLVDHALLATGFRVDISRYLFLSQSLLKQLATVEGYPVLKPASNVRFRDCISSASLQRGVSGRSLVLFRELSSQRTN